MESFKVTSLNISTAFLNREEFEYIFSDIDILYDAVLLGLLRFQRVSEFLCSCEDKVRISYLDKLFRELPFLCMRKFVIWQYVPDPERLFRGCSNLLEDYTNTRSDYFGSNKGHDSDLSKFGFESSGDYYICYARSGSLLRSYGTKNSVNLSTTSVYSKPIVDKDCYIMILVNKNSPLYINTWLSQNPLIYILSSTIYKSVKFVRLEKILWRRM